MCERERNSLMVALLVFWVGVLFMRPSLAATEDYYWWQSNYYSDRFEHPDAACQMHLRDAKIIYSTAYISSFELRTGSNGPFYECHIRRINTSNVDVAYQVSTITRIGSSCASGTTLNPETALCDAPLLPGGEKCGEEVVSGITIPKITNSEGQCVPFYDADKPSQCMHFAQSTRFTTIYISVDDDGNPVPPSSIIKDGCEANVLSIDHCKVPAPKKTGTVMLSPAPIRCRVALNFTGNPSNGDPPSWTTSPGDPGSVCEPGSTCLPPDEPLVNDSKPCVYVPDAEGRMVCDASQYTGKPGDYSNCGTASTVNGGSFTCLGSNPSSTGTMTNTKVDTKVNSDGSSTTTKTDTQTKVVCSGVGSCTSQVTTNVTTTTKDPNGNITSEESKCTGPNCKPSGGIGDGNSTGNGSGSGSGNGEGDGEEEEGPPGPSRNLQQGEQGNFDEALSEWDERISSARTELDQKLEEYGALFKGVFDLNLGAGGGALPCETFSISTGGVSLRICPADYSDQLSYLRYVLLLAAAALAAIIVLRG